MSIGEFHFSNDVMDYKFTKLFLENHFECFLEQTTIIQLRLSFIYFATRTIDRLC